MKKEIVVDIEKVSNMMDYGIMEHLYSSYRVGMPDHLELGRNFNNRTGMFVGDVNSDDMHFFYHALNKCTSYSEPTGMLFGFLSFLGIDLTLLDFKEFSFKKRYSEIFDDNYSKYEKLDSALATIILQCKMRTNSTRIYNEKIDNSLENIVSNYKIGISMMKNNFIKSNMDDFKNFIKSYATKSIIDVNPNEKEISHLISYRLAHIVEVIKDIDIHNISELTEYKNELQYNLADYIKEKDSEVYNIIVNSTISDIIRHIYSCKVTSDSSCVNMSHSDLCRLTQYEHFLCYEHQEAKTKQLMDIYKKIVIDFSNEFDCYRTIQSRELKNNSICDVRVYFKCFIEHIKSLKNKLHFKYDKLDYELFDIIINNLYEEVDSENILNIVNDNIYNYYSSEFIESVHIDSYRKIISNDIISKDDLFILKNKTQHSFDIITFLIEEVLKCAVNIISFNEEEGYVEQ